MFAMKKKRSTKIDLPEKATTSWDSRPVYARYWQHYLHSMLWMQSHQNAYRKFWDSCFTSAWFFPHGVLPWNSLAYEAGHPWNSQGQHMEWQESPYSGSTREDEALREEEELASDSDEEVECDLSNTEITEELRQYFAQTEAQRRLLNDYLNADHGLYFNDHRSAEPLSETPWEQRQVETKRLYGNSAPKILAMEAAVQLSFDNHCDRKQLKYWPVIPLKF
uniref:Gem-associated protein 8 n=1 Tax=Rattus norvegicus TaxID=10116 RepID=A0A8I5ZLJ0_RAT